MNSLRLLLKKILPQPLRFFIRSFYYYLNGFYIWLKVLTQMRGSSINDQFKLLVSAILSPITGLKIFITWQPPTLLFNTNVNVFGIGKFKLRSFTDDLWHVLPHVEIDVLNWIKNNLSDGDTFVDAGANIGLYTITASKIVGKNGKVISFEMMPDTASILTNHIQMNDLSNVNLIQKGLSDKENEVLIARVPKGSHGQASIADFEMKGDIIEVEVQTSTLDSAFSDINCINVMKMDLEGVELKVLKAATNSLGKVENLIFESWPENEYKDDKVKLFLEEKNYNVVNLDQRNCLAKKVN